jgi:hypothetical protein
MGDFGNILARHGLGFLTGSNQNQGSAQTQAPNQNSQAQASSGGWLRGLFHKEDVPPPPAPKPPGVDDTFRMGAWDRVRVGNRNLEQIAGTMYNENKGVHARDARQQPELDRGIKAIGHAILNGSRENVKLKEVAPWQVSEKEKKSSLYQHYLDLARDVLREDFNGVDPVGGRINYNHRFDNDASIRKQKTKHGNWVPIPGETVYDRIGPFPNASKTNPEARIVIYNPEEKPKSGKSKSK